MERERYWTSERLRKSAIERMIEMEKEEQKEREKNESIFAKFNRSLIRDHMEMTKRYIATVEN